MRNPKVAEPQKSAQTALGIDIGGSGIKAAVVDLKSGELLTPRLRLKTPKPANPETCKPLFESIREHFDWTGPIGCGFPGIIKDGHIRSAANLDKGWLGMDFHDYMRSLTGCSVQAVNDADAAGLAELNFGAARDLDGLVILLTIGTGIGSCIILNGKLSPNSELGHLKYKQKTIEAHASGMIREREKLSWKSWGTRFNGVLRYLEFLLNPDVFIIGGGVAKRFDRFESCLKVEASCMPARFRNRAGIIGAAASTRLLRSSSRA